MKKKLSLLLALLIVLTSIPFTGVKAEGFNYKLSDGTSVETFNDSNTLIRSLQNLDPNKKYTLTLNADLDLSTCYSPIQIENDFRIDGNNHKISLMESRENCTEAIQITGGNSVFNNLIVDGYIKDPYPGIPEPEPEPWPDPEPWPNYPYNQLETSPAATQPPIASMRNADEGEARLDSASFVFIKGTKDTIPTDKEEFKDNPSLTMNKCTLTNIGSCAIYSESAFVNLNTCEFLNNWSQTSDTDRKKYVCIDSESSVFNIDSCTFTGNKTNEQCCVSFRLYCDAKITKTNFIKNDCDKTAYAGVGGKIYMNDVTFMENKSTYCAGLDTLESDANLSNVRFIKNDGDRISALELSSGKHTVDNCTFTDNNSKSGSTIKIGYWWNNDLKGTISNSLIARNTAGECAGISSNGTFSVIEGKLYTKIKVDIDLINLEFSDNKSEGKNAKGGAIYNLDANLNIKSCKFLNNYASMFGGAIYHDMNTEKLELFTEKTNRKNFPFKINISSDTEFKGNKAGFGYYNPPDEFEEYTNLGFKNNSLEKKLLKAGQDGNYKHVRSLLNNYDVFYLNERSYTNYDPNGGQGKIRVFDEGESRNRIGMYTEYKDMNKRNITVKSPEEIGIYNDTKFLGWNTELDGTGTTYQPGVEIKAHMGNQWLYAMWQETAKPTILTLDENHRGGKVTDKDVMLGEAIDEHLYKPKRRGHTFKGWSYNKKHLDKVHYDDRVYEPTTIYAIWDEVEEEPEEIKGMTHKAYIFGYPDGTVRPNGKITRAEAAAMLTRLLEIESIGSAAKPMFPDTESAWYNKAINASVQRGIMKGYPDGSFKPNNPITRAEFTQMISTIDNKAYGVAPFADVLGHWAERPIGSEYQAGRIAGYPDGTFRPDAHITRCEAAVILNKIFERNFDAMSLLKCKNPQMIKYFIDLDASFWGYNDMVEATNTHEYVRRDTNRVPEDWLLIK